MQCITDVITQTAADLMAFQILPWVINEQLFMSEPAHHKFNAAYGSMMHKDDDIPGGSVSILKQDSNGIGHAIENGYTDELYSTGYGNILLNRCRFI